jgi:hypothetical protein
MSPPTSPKGRSIPIRDGMNIGLPSIEPESLGVKHNSMFVHIKAACSAVVKTYNSSVKSDNTHLFVFPCKAGHTIGVSFLISSVFFRDSFGNGDVFSSVFFRDSFGNGNVLEEKDMIFF